MKRIYFAFTALLFTQTLLSQTTSNLPGAKIVLTTGQKVTVETDLSIEASLGMGMEMVSSSISTNSLDVKSSTEKTYTVSNTLTKLKMNMSSMGQSNSYDSENKESNSEEMAGFFDERMNKPVDVIIDNNTGMSITEKKKDKKADDGDNANMMGDMLGMFSNSSDDAVVSGAFEIAAAGKRIGDSWSDTSISKEMKIFRTYTLNSLTGNEAIIKVAITSSAKNKLDFQGMEFEIATETKTTGDIISDISTGLVKKRNTVSDITGSFQLMGQDMPITAKTTSVSIYK
ncbi:MAG: DUF6263 family protein [Ferruginibacter sp.]